MANNFLSLYHAFNPKTLQDLLISPYTVGCRIIGKNGTLIYHNGQKWIVVKNALISSFFETDVEQEAVDAFWRCEVSEAYLNG